LLVLPWLFGALVAQGGYSESQAGWVTTAEIAALAASSLLLARRATSSNRRRIAAIGLSVAILVNCVAAFIAPSGVCFILTRVLSGAGLGAAVAVGNAAAAGAKHPTRAFAFLWVLLALWQLVIFNATPWVIGHAGLSGVYGLIAGGCLIFLPLVLQMPDATALRSPANFIAPGRSSVRLVTALVAAAFLCFWLRDALVYALSERLAALHGLSGQYLGEILGVASVCALAGPALAARLGDREPSFVLLGSSLLLVLCTSSAMVLAPSSSLFTIATLLSPATLMFAMPLLSGLAAEADATGRLAALGAGVGFVSEAFGPAIGGMLMEFGGLTALSVAIVAVGLSTVATSLVAAGCLRRARRRRAANPYPAKR
jgi:DHA1 family inner membrane transport protein